MNIRVPVLLLLGSISFAATQPAQRATDLFLRGYSVIPAPRQVELEAGDVEIDESWGVDAGALGRDHIAVRSLQEGLREFHALELKPAGSQTKNVIRLAVAKGAVRTGDDTEIDRQGYLMKTTPGLIQLTGNAEQGLFYGVQTLLQLVRADPRGRLLLPVSAIQDWPRLQLRFLHWDTKHHQDRLETLKRYLDWAARFKVNMIGFELEDKFAYPSNPIIGAPGAFTAAELQEIVNYGLQRFIQVVPQIQSPAHMAYVLKHPQFARLRADGNNYQVDLCNPESYKLIFQMYDDVIKATSGIDYFFVSTDEIYYAGIGDKCEQPVTPERHSLKWIEFARRARDFLAARNRKMLAWVEYPLLPEHARMLPPDIIDGVMGEAEYAKTENELGMRQLIYVSMQGAELLFPNHLPGFMTMGGDLGPSEGRLKSAFQAISSGRIWQANPIGVYGAAWGDSGLHSETFWLGWATVAAYGWAPGIPPVEQTVAEFMTAYYGTRVSDMVEVYRGLQAQAGFYERSWDRVISTTRGSGYGNSDGKGIGTTRFDHTLPQPGLPAMPGLRFTPVYAAGRYATLVEDAARAARENSVLVHRLYQNLGKADRNRHNLEVFLSLAELTGHHNRLLLGMREIEDRLRTAREQAEKNAPQEAVGHLVAAYEQARGIVEERHRTYRRLTAVWEKSRFPKGREVNGRKFLHVLDDTKDHVADRRADLTYMTAPEESIELEQWMKNLAAVLQDYARKNNVTVRALQEPRLEQ
ncbi:MAG: beta-N-acetylhexosaminidase [Blastocatellia bacterium]